MMEREDLQDFESMKKTAGWFKRTARGRPNGKGTPVR